MDAVKFITTTARICNDNSCATCALRIFCSKICRERTKDDVVKVEKIIEEWLKTHPTKTRQSEFLEMYPDALKDRNGVVNVNPCLVDRVHYTTPACGCGCEECRKQYWLKEVE